MRRRNRTKVHVCPPPQHQTKLRYLNLLTLSTMTPSDHGVSKARKAEGLEKTNLCAIQRADKTPAAQAQPSGPCFLPYKRAE